MSAPADGSVAGHLKVPIFMLTQSMCMSLPSGITCTLSMRWLRQTARNCPTLKI